MQAPTDEWSLDSSFWQDMYPAMFTPNRLAASDAEVAAVLALTGVSSGSVLDMCCGAGRHALRFAARGFAVTGVDGTPYLLDQAREAAALAELPVEWVRADMRSFVREGAFDLSVNMFMSFGYSDDRADDLLSLQNIHRSLKAGGTFVLDVVGKEVMARIYQPVVSSRLSDGTLIVRSHRVDEDWSRIHNEWLVIKGDQMTRRRFSFTVYSGVEMRELLIKAGFAQVDLFGTMQGTPYDASSLKLVAVARKAL